MNIANVALGNVGCKPDWSRLCNWLERRRPDIVTLQKIGPSKDIPKGALQKTGYKSRLLPSPHWYLGVAVLSHRDLPEPEVLPGLKQKEESRFLTVDIGGYRVSSVCAPFNKQAIERRVAWLNQLREHVAIEGYADRQSLLCGDFNVMADGPPWREGYTQDEKEVLQELMDLGYCDLYRRAHPDHEKKRGWTRGYSEDSPSKGSNRLHLILASESLKRRLRSACVDVESRPWPRKDAPPLVVELVGVSF